MKRTAILFCLAAALLPALAACKGDTDDKAPREGFLLAKVALYTIPGAKGTPNQKWVATANRGELVTVLPQTNAPAEWMEVMLADKKTRGWLPARWVHVGERNPVTFLGETEWFERPDEQSPKKAKPLPTGQVGFIIEERDGWVHVNIDGDWSKGWVRQGSFERGFVTVKQVPQEERVFTVRTAVGECTVSASSWLVEGAFSYGPEMAFDGKLETSWQEGKKGQGIGEWIEIRFPQHGTYRIKIVNGFVKTDAKHGDLYAKNGRVARLGVSVDGGAEQSVDLLDEVKTAQTVGDFEGERLRLVIRDVYPGSDWDDTAVSEIAVLPVPRN